MNLFNLARVRKSSSLYRSKGLPFEIGDLQEGDLCIIMSYDRLRASKKIKKGDKEVIMVQIVTPIGVGWLFEPEVELL